MNIRRKNLNLISTKEWLKLKPYKKPTDTDAYYLRLCNEIKHTIISKRLNLFLLNFLDDSEINLLTYFLTSYLEDLVSESNIWNTFILKHKELYNKILPFYDLNDYYENEINLQDVNFLIWYFINTVQDNNRISPLNESLLQISEAVMEIFEREWEYAPENKVLKQYYCLNAENADYYETRNMMTLILLSTYLFYPDTGLKFLQEVTKIVDEEKDNPNILAYINELQDLQVNNQHTQLLSLKPKEWLAAILGNKHLLYDDILAISPKITGYFFYRGQDNENIFLEHIASGMKFNLTKKSYSQHTDFKQIDSVLHIGIVKWQNEWWFSGSSLFIDNNSNHISTIIDKEKKSLKSKQNVDFLINSYDEKIKLLELQYNAFLNFNGNKQIAFMESKKIDSFIQNFIKHYNDSLNPTDEQKEKNKEFEEKSAKINLTEKLIKISESSLVFFNPKSGMETAADINSAFPDPYNPFFNPDNSLSSIMLLLTDKSLSTELVMYCVDNYKDKLSFFSTTDGKIYAENIDFVLRFWKIKNYYSQPRISIAS